MPAQVVAGLFNAGYGPCEKCGDMHDLASITLRVDDHSNTVVSVADSPKICIRCVADGDKGDYLGGAKTCVELEHVTNFPDRSKSARRGVSQRVKKRERECAEDIGGSTTPASGAGVVKGDARNDKWMVDDKLKVTNRTTYVVDERTARKMIGQAHKSGRNGVLRVGLRSVNLAICLWEDFVELIHE